MEDHQVARGRPLLKGQIRSLAEDKQVGIEDHYIVSRKTTRLLVEDYHVSVKDHSWNVRSGHS